MSDSKSSGGGHQEDYPLSAVPEDDRRGAASLYVVLLGFTFFAATMWSGGEVGRAFRFFPDLLIIILAGNVLLGAYVAVLAHISARTGLNTVLLSRFAFGERGSGLVDLLLGLTQVGWYAWGTGTVATVLLRLIGLDEPWLLYLFMIVFGAGFCWTAYIGYRGLEILSIIAVPLMLVLIFWSMFRAWIDVDGLAGLTAIEPGASMSVSNAITIVFGTFASGGTQVTNWTRFARTSRTAVLAALSAFLLGNGLMVFVGALGALVYDRADLVEVLVAQGLLLPGVAMLFLNIWTTQDNTIYNFSVAGSNLLRTGHRRLVTLGGAALGTVLAVLGMYDFLVPFLLLLGVLIPPVGAVIVADAWINRRLQLPALAGASLPALSVPGLVAYAAGCLAALLSQYYAWGLPPLFGVGVALFLHVLLSRAAAKAA